MGGSSSNGWMVIGEVVGHFGIRGELKVELRTDFPERFEELNSVYLGTERREYVVDGSRLHKRQVLLRLQGITTPEAAERVRGQEIAVPRQQAVDLPEGHYYLDDLMGIHVSGTDGRDLGVITDVLRTGSNDVYVVGRGPASVLIPGIQDAVAELDLQARRLVVEPWVLDSAE